MAVGESTLCFGTALRKASRRMTLFYDDALSGCGLRSTQFAILAELAERASAPPTVGELAAALVTDRSALGHTLRPLERDGLVALIESADDRRRRLVTLTPLGIGKCAEAAVLWRKAQDRFRAVFGAEEAARLRATLLGLASDERLTGPET